MPPVDSGQDLRSEMCLILEQMGIPVEVHHHEVAGAGQNEIGTKFSTLVQRADWTATAEVRHHQRRPRLRQDRDLHAQAPGRRQRLSGMHVHQSIWKDGRTCSPATAAGLSVSRCTTSAASSSTPAR